jgi:hypothetical protein
MHTVIIQRLLPTTWWLNVISFVKWWVKILIECLMLSIDRRFKSIRIYRTVCSVLVLAIVLVQTLVNTFVAHWNVCNTTVLHVGISILIIQWHVQISNRCMIMNHRRWFTSHWCETHERFKCLRTVRVFSVHRFSLLCFARQFSFYQV